MADKAATKLLAVKFKVEGKIKSDILAFPFLNLNLCFLASSFFGPQTLTADRFSVF